LKRKLKVLKLGWEFPPMLTGGLGPACYGLSKALSQHVDLTIILPRSDINFKLDEANIIGLNHLTYDEIKEELRTHDYKKFAVVETVYSPVDSYPIDVKVNLEEFAVSQEEAQKLFADTDSYGPNIMRKVAAYTDMVLKLAEQHDFDIIHAHDWITFPAALKLKQRSRKPLIVHIHSLESDRVHPGARNMVYDIELEAMQKADIVIPVSNFTKENIVKYYGIYPDKIQPVHNGVDTTANYKTKKDNNEKWVLFLGRVTRQKGPEFLFETAAKLIRKMDNVRFYIAGIGDRLLELKHKTEMSGLQDKIIFTGHINKTQVHDLLSKVDAYFMPSISEPFGLSALEAAQFNIPCVISKQSGVAEVLPNALKADYWDTGKMANYLYGVLNYNGLKETVVEQTKKDMHHVSWEKAAQEVLQSYETLMKK
jgi:glycogen(starch) synthase